MKKKLGICFLAVLLWISPLAALYQYSMTSVEAKSYDLIVINEPGADSPGRMGSPFDYMIYSGIISAIVITSIAIGNRRSRIREEEKRELMAAKYLGDLL